MNKKAGLKLADPKDETASLKARFDELLEKTNKTNPSEKDVKAFRQLLRDNPEQKLWLRVAGLMIQAEGFTLDCGPLTQGLNALLLHRQDDIRERLGYDGAMGLEKLLISHAALCWLRLGLIEMTYSNVMKGNNSLKVANYWDRHLAAAQRRFTRACETLERVRLLARTNQGLRLVGTKVA